MTASYAPRTMTQERFDIWILGWPEIPRDKALARVAGAFRISEELAGRFVTDDPIRARSDVDRRKAERFQSVLLKIGAEVVITPHGADAPDPTDFAETSIDEAAPPAPRPRAAPTQAPAPREVARVQIQKHPVPPRELPTAPAPPPRRSIRPELPSGYLPAVTDEHDSVEEAASAPPPQVAPPPPQVAPPPPQAAPPPLQAASPPLQAASPPLQVSPPPLQVSPPQRAARPEPQAAPVAPQPAAPTTKPSRPVADHAPPVVEPAPPVVELAPPVVAPASPVVAPVPPVVAPVAVQAAPHAAPTRPRPQPLASQANNDQPTGAPPTKAPTAPVVRRSMEIPQRPTRQRGALRRALPWVATLLISAGLGVGGYYYYEYSQTALPRVAEARIAGAHQNHLPEFVETETTERIDIVGSTPATLAVPIERNRCVAVVSTVIGGECDLDATLSVGGEVVSVDEYTNATPIVYACTHDGATAELALQSYAGDSCRAGVRVFERMMTSASIDAEIVSIHASRYLADPEPVDRARTHIDLEAGASHTEVLQISPGCWGVVGQSSHGSDVDLYVHVGGETIARDDAWDNLTIAEYCSEATTELSLEFEMYSGEGELSYQVFRTPHQAGLRVLPQLEPDAVETASAP